MKITPEYIRAKQQETKACISMLTDTLLEDFVSEFISMGYVIIPINKISEHGISADIFMDELKNRGFIVNTYTSDFSDSSSCSIKIALPLWKRLNE